MLREYVHWNSPNLGRGMELLCFGHAGRPVLAFPTSMGRFYQYEDFNLVGALAGKMDAGEIRIICLDTVDEESWYNSSSHPAQRAKRQDQYDRYVEQEVVPYVRHRTGRGDLAVFGASFGAYHAANVAGRHPDMVAKAILFSGLYDIHRYLDGYWDDTCYFHCPTAYIPNMDESWTCRLARVHWVIATGEFDTLAEDNRRFSEILWSKGIPNHAEFWPGVFGHDWPWWRENLPRFLP